MHVFSNPETQLIYKHYGSYLETQMDMRPRHFEEIIREIFEWTKAKNGEAVNDMIMLCLEKVNWIELADYFKATQWSH